MRFNYIRISDDMSKKYGLLPAQINRLGSVVAIIGKNGSGKSRFLNYIESDFIDELNVDDFYNSVVDLPKTDSLNLYNAKTQERKYFDLTYRISDLQKKLKENLLTPAEIQKFTRELHSSTVEMQNIGASNKRVGTFLQNPTKHVNNTKNSIRKWIRRINYSEIHQLKESIDNDKGNQTFEEIINRVANNDIFENELKIIHRTALTYLSKLPHQLVYDMDDCYGDVKEFKKRDSYRRYETLRRRVYDFLGKELIWKKVKSTATLTSSGVSSESVGKWYINDRVFNYAEFSDGEKTLFAYSLLFFLLEENPKIPIKDCIIIIDEPELHLHPESEVALIRGIKNVIGNDGQLIIATHSINILAELSYDEIYMIKGGEVVTPKRTTPGNTFIELMGEYIDKLSYFVTNISNWAFLNFINQCFINPEVVKSANKNDPEIEVFKASISSDKTAKLLLDFGAGQGRIYREITNDDLLLDKISYSALETDESNRTALAELNISKIYSNYSELPVDAFDYILLCNVLHEVPIKEWEKNLNCIKNSLKDSGNLIIIEDLRLPKGEKVDGAGFLILDLNSIQKLFSMPDLPLSIMPTEKAYMDRIQCAVIKKGQIGVVNNKSIFESLTSLQTFAFEKVKKIREQTPSTENKLALGRESALYSQLFVNAAIAKEILTAT